MESGSRYTRSQSKRSIDCVEGIEDSAREGKRSRMEEKLDMLLKGQDEIKKELGARIDDVEKGVRTVNSRVDGLDVAIDNLHQRIQQVEAQSSKGSGSETTVAAYWKARRSIRIGPSNATNNQEAVKFLRQLFTTDLKLPEWEVDSQRIEDVSLVVRHNRAKGQDFTMVLITFMEVAHRDRIFSRVSKLPAEMKMEMVIPNHMIAKYKSMEKRAYELRKDDRKTLIRFNDNDLGLILLAREKTIGAKWNEVTVNDVSGGRNQNKQ